MLGPVPGGPLQGPVAKGNVVDSNDNPVTGAIARLGFEGYSNLPHGRTDEDGNYQINGGEPGQSAVTIQASGFAPQIKKITLNENTPPVDFVLERGHEVKIRVVDDTGQPLAGVSVAASEWRGMQTISARSVTNADGIYTWNNAPAQRPGLRLRLPAPYIPA